MESFEEPCKDYLDQAPYGLLIFDKKGKLLEVNPEACRVSGQSREYLLSKTIHELIPEKSIKESRKYFVRLLKNGRSSGVIIYERPDCRECYLDIDAVKISDNRYFAFARDVTKEKKTKENLNKRLMLEKIISSFSSMLTIVDTDNIYDEIYKSFALLGKETDADRIYFFTYSDDLVYCSNIYEWCSKGILPQIKNLQNIRTDSTPWWTAKMNSNKPIMFEDIEDFPPEAAIEKEILSAQGIKSVAIIPSFYNGRLKGFFGFDSVKRYRRWTDDDIYLLRMAGNSLCNSIIRVQDQKERYRLEEQMASIERLDSIGKLAGGVAHDFNNIMQIISGFTELAMNSECEAVRKYLDQIQNASAKASALTGQLLAFARKQHISPKPADLNSAVKKSVSLLERLIGPDITIDLKTDQKLWPVVIDLSQVDQIITNMLLNSRDSISGRGKIIIETYNDVIDEEYCKHHPYCSPGEYAVLTVSDTGCGMDEETKKHIFEPFFSTKPMNGTGLGLSTVYGIVKQNNGYILVYSEEGMGTSFKIYLKKGDLPVPENPKETEKNQSRSVKNKNILVVEDEEPILTLISRVLEKSDYNVVTAENGEQAFSAVSRASEKFDLLLTDVVMPGMNGNEINDKIQEIYPEIKTIFMSGYTANIIADRGILEKGINFLQKPFTVSQLLEKVNTVLG